MSENETTYPFIVRFFKHLHTINTHRRIVRKNCFACGIYYQGITHDLSKYSPTEFWVSVKYFLGYRSPYMKEKALKGYSLGWLHHKGRNKHHWEYWYDMINGEWIPLQVPYRYVVEMVCDRVAACKVYQKEKYTQRSALEYFQTRNDKLYMHPKTAEELRKMLTEIAENGEAAAFAQFKENIKNKYTY